MFKCTHSTNMRDRLIYILHLFQNSSIIFKLNYIKLLHYQSSREDKNDPLAVQAQLHDDCRRNPVVSHFVTSVASVAAPSTQIGIHVGPVPTMSNQVNPEHHTKSQLTPIATTCTSFISYYASACEGIITAMKLHIVQQHNGQPNH